MAPDPTPPTEAERLREDFLHYWADADNAVARALCTDLDALLAAVRAEERETLATDLDVTVKKARRRAAWCAERSMSAEEAECRAVADVLSLRAAALREGA